MPVHPQYRVFLDHIAAAGRSANPDPPLAERRANYRAMQPVAPDIPVAHIEERRIPGPGGEIPVRIYTPPGKGPFPAFMHFHGGGWVIGDLDTVDALSREICRLAHCVVVAVDYRLAPEHRFPAAADDCYTATQWVSSNAAALDVDAGRIAVGGDSAGGNLAAVVSLMARDRNGPPIVFQVLVVPVLDADFDTASYRENADGYLLTRATMEWFWDHYCPGRADRAHPYASPIRAPDLSGLPPALVMTAEFDPLRDEGKAYARALEVAGVPSEYVEFEGFIHVFYPMFHVLPVGRAGVDKVAAALRHVFDR